MCNILKLIRLLGCVILLSGMLVSVAHAEGFTVRSIRVEGNQRVSIGTILNYLPVKEGEQFNSAHTADVIKALYNTGFFSEVDVNSSNGVLYIKVNERPVITAINIAGSNKITKKQLLDVLKQIGLTEGQVFNQAALSGVEQALVQQYYNLGCYNVKVDTQLVPQPRHRVAIDIKIVEGPVAKMKEINIIGNKAFKTSELLDNFSIMPVPMWKVWSYFTSDDKYSRDKLEGDLEKLRSFYMDRGYLQFNIESVQVSLTPDKKGIYVVIHINEGAIYRISGYSLSGNLLGKEKEMEKLVTLKKGEIFSRKDVMDIKASLERFIGDFGYAASNIRPEPEINEASHTVFVKFNIDVGKRVYVRRISFSGNTKTDESVLRREMRQQEGAVYSLSKVEESKRRLANLVYIEAPDFKVEPVPGQPDQVDLQGKVKEVSSASATFNFGYANAEGLVYGASVTEQNFLGTGKEVGLQFSNSKVSRTYGLSYYNPYFTDNNISMRFNTYLQTQKPSRLNLSPYSMDVIGLAMIFGVPLSDYSRWTFGYGFERIKISSDLSVRSIQVNDFMNKYGDTFNEFKLTTGWSRHTYDRAIFPTHGLGQSVSLEVNLPAKRGSLSFYRANYEATWYQPLSKSFILNLHCDFGYGRGFGNTKDLPFFKRYYAGGMGTVRGFDLSSLGPLDNRGRPMGGNVSAIASAGLIFPNPLGESVRTLAFVDVGNVFDDKIQLSEVRSSVGLQVEWRSPMGLLRFSLAKPIRSKTGDRQRLFDFAIGTSL
jgi:outer membrane protein insertion porin family